MGCLNDNLWCHRWWQGRLTGDILFSVMVILNMLFLCQETVKNVFIASYLKLIKIKGCIMNNKEESNTAMQCTY